MTEKRETTALAKVDPTAIATPDYGFDVARVVAMRAAAEEVVEKVLREGEHYGAIPGTVQEGKKPKKVLLLPGAEVLCQVFRLRPKFHEITVVERDDFIYYKFKCELFNSVTGECVGEALGSANTREKKYSEQTAVKLCPSCGKPTIFRSKKREGDTREPGYFCWMKKGGCGAEFAAEDKKLLDQSSTISTDKIWDLAHTVLSQGQKRAYVRAVRNATGTSNIFTDEDSPPEDDDHGGGSSGGQAPKPSAGPKAGVSEVTKLNAALNTLGIGGGVNPSLPKAEQNEQVKKVKLAWVNEMLKGAGEPPVTGMMELTPKQISELVAKAERREVPQGWE